ncbi:MAG: PD-(D/E)XK nuclease family protein [Candidatus Tectomicrobia bacterium]|uniref:PD-(D/E)XK nuclease family protein n=1 Tax=Tectimicrobiota bacterium TaxID=2528274 RepID=A0A932CPJ6_UNCTE|nr:PD-(D/E)XK nuclease family protein [Candidatus Tectomicrobia bacterium]
MAILILIYGLAARWSPPAATPPLRVHWLGGPREASADQVRQEETALARRGRNSPIVQRAVASGRYYREVFVSTPLAEGLLEGFVDLLFKEDGGWVIADYKTDAVASPEELQDAQERYALQVGAYALAVQEVTGKPVREVVLVFLNCQRGGGLGGYRGAGREGSGTGWGFAGGRHGEKRSVAVPMKKTHDWLMARDLLLCPIISEKVIPFKALSCPAETTPGHRRAWLEASCCNPCLRREGSEWPPESSRGARTGTPHTASHS